jgi:glycosyltransferase involved in cell wall biosynthesis
MEPLVSICCFAYNHERYILECMEGFLIQQTNFPFEVIIHDDASTDNTADIIRGYSAKYPDLFRPIYQTTNQYSIEKGLVSKTVYNSAKGKYISICEGDDYWTDPLKLQKQVDFMENNADFSLCHTDAFVKLETTGKISLNNNNFTGLSQIEIKKRLLIGQYRIYTCTALFRKSFFDFIPFEDCSKFQMGDFFLWNHLIHMGNFHFMNDITSVRRCIPESASRTTTNFEKMITFWDSVIDMGIYFKEKYIISEDLFGQMMWFYNSQKLDYYLKSNNRKKYRDVYQSTKLQFGSKYIKKNDFIHYKLSYLPFAFKFSKILQLKKVIIKMQAVLK